MTKGQGAARPIESSGRALSGADLVTERKLVHTIRKGRTKAIRTEARNRLAESARRLPPGIAKRYRGHSVEVADLVQEGNIALLRAAKNYRPGKSRNFGTFAAVVVERAIQRTIQEGGEIRLSQHTESRTRALILKKDELRAELGREPSSEELAKALRFSLRLVRRLEATEETKRLQSLDEEVGEDGESAIFFWQHLPDSQVISPEVICLAREELALKVRTIQADYAWVMELSDRRRDTFRYRYGLNRANEPVGPVEIGENWHVSRNAVHQMLQRIWRERRPHGQTEQGLVRELEHIRNLAEALGERVKWRL